MFTVKIKKLKKEAFLPEFKNKGSMILNLKTPQDLVIKPNSGLTVLFGFAIQFETKEGEVVQGGLELQIRPSQAILHKGVTSHLGTIDPQYRGGVGVTLHNHSKNSVTIPRGAIVAEGTVNQIPIISLQTIEVLSDTPRGERGFGHTGGTV